ncbi:MAG: metallophosphoesterase [Bryobacteraceae bacterium]|nr:metallophosphoesterase [Bryobacteraceae bacterium]
MERLYRWGPEIAVMAAICCMQLHMAWWAARRHPQRILWIRLALAAAWLYFFVALLLRTARFGPLVDPWWGAWVRGGALMFGLCTGVFYCAWLLWSRVQHFSPERRGLLRAAHTAMVAAPLAATGFGIAVSRRFVLTEVELPVKDLPADLNGLRIVQLSDIHLGPFLDERDVAYVVDMANETRAHLAVVTGDLISGKEDPLEACIKQCARLRSDAGILACHGNHEVYAGVIDAATQWGENRGIHFLRHANRQLRFGSAVLNVAGVDYQRFFRPYLVGAEELAVPGAVNLLLSHNPDVLPVAAQKGFQTVLAGHTHGGQVSFEILESHVNVARIFTPYVYGRYISGPSSLYVTRGIGTIGMPVRLGAPPEVALIRLCAS